MMYLGSVGRMVKLGCAAAQEVSRAPRYVYQTTVEGNRRAQALPSTAREWSISMPVSAPLEMAALSDFATGAWGNGPFIFLSETALATNALSPSISNLTLSGAHFAVNRVAGPTNIEGNPVASTITTSDQALGIFFGIDYLPVLPGMPITGAAWIQGENCRVAITFYTESNAYVGDFFGAVRGSADALTRQSVTVPASRIPANATKFRLRALLTTTATRPSVTYTSALHGWGEGQGCMKAVVDDFSTGTVLAVHQPGWQYQTDKFMVREVS